MAAGWRAGAASLPGLCTNGSTAARSSSRVDAPAGYFGTFTLTFGAVNGNVTSTRPKCADLVAAGLPAVSCS